MSAKLLVVADYACIGETVAAAMTPRGFSVSWKASAPEGLRILEEEDFDAVVTDLQFDTAHALDFCEQAVARRPDVPLIVLTAFETLDRAIAAIRAGAYDFVVKPFNVEMLRITVARALEHHALRDEVNRLRQSAVANRELDKIIGSSPAIRRVIELMESAADSNAAVLITGEPGTGKELVAATVHQMSRRATGPFLSLHCAAMAEPLLESELFGNVQGQFADARTHRPGLFSKAHGGTLFLDEIDEIPMGLQTRLLRALRARVGHAAGSTEEERYDARIIVATHRDLEAQVESGRLREDLFYCLNVMPIAVPPLRGRDNDVLMLARHFLTRFSMQSGKEVVGFSPPVAQKFVDYAWPGNVRELQNCVERAVAFTRHREVGIEDLPEKVRDHHSVDLSIPGIDKAELMSMDEVEKRYILRVLKQVAGNKTVAAEVLGLDRRTLYRKLDRYGEEASLVSSRANDH